MDGLNYNKTMEELKIEIKIKPLSVNKAWQGRRYKTPEYKAWRESIGWKLMPYRMLACVEWCDVEFDFYIKSYASADTDNLLKTAIDSIVEAGIIKDDRYIKKITATKHRAKEERILVNIIPHAEAH